MLKSKEYFHSILYFIKIWNHPPENFCIDVPTKSARTIIYHDGKESNSEMNAKFITDTRRLSEF